MSISGTDGPTRITRMQFNMAAHLYGRNYKQDRNWMHVALPIV